MAEWEMVVVGRRGLKLKFSRSQDNRHNAHVTHAETCRGIVGAVECSNNQPYNLLDSQNIITHIVIPLQSYCNLNTTFRRLAMSPTCCKVMTNPLPVAYSTPAKWYYIINPTMSERISWCCSCHGRWLNKFGRECSRGTGDNNDMCIDKNSDLLRPLSHQIV